MKFTLKIIVLLSLSNFAGFKLVKQGNSVIKCVCQLAYLSVIFFKFYLTISELYFLTHPSGYSFINVPGQAHHSFSPFLLPYEWFPVGLNCETLPEFSSGLISLGQVHPCLAFRAGRGVVGCNWRIKWGALFFVPQMKGGKNLIWILFTSNSSCFSEYNCQAFYVYIINYDLLI